MTRPRPDDQPGRGPGAPLDSGLTSPTDPAAVLPEPELGPAADTGRGRVAVVDGVLVLTGEVDGDLCRAWAELPGTGPTALVAAVDARAVTHLGSEGLALLAGIARDAAVPLPLWAGDRVVLRPLRLVGLDGRFDLHDLSSPTG